MSIQCTVHNYKIKVPMGKSNEIENLFFKLGGSWSGVQENKDFNSKYLFLTNGGISFCNYDKTFEDINNKEISFNELLGIVKNITNSKVAIRKHGDFDFFKQQSFREKPNYKLPVLVGLSGKKFTRKPSGVTKINNLSEYEFEKLLEWFKDGDLSEVESQLQEQPLNEPLSAVSNDISNTDLVINAIRQSLNGESIEGFVGYEWNNIDNLTLPLLRQIKAFRIEPKRIMLQNGLYSKQELLDVLAKEFNDDSLSS